MTPAKTAAPSTAARALAATAVWHVATAPRLSIDSRGRRRPLVPLLDRFMANVHAEGDCWVWSKTPNTKGYAPFYVSQFVAISAHRWIYTLMVAEIPEGLQLDHLCRRRACVCPWHLDPVDNRENQRRGEHPTAGVAFRTNTCPQGHSLADAYLSRNSRSGRSYRRCRPCQQRRYAEYIARKRGMAA